MDRRFFLAGAAAAAAPTAALAQAPSVAPAPAQAPGFFRFRLGDVVVTTIHDGFVRRANTLEGFITNAPAADIQRALDEAALPAQGLLNPYVVTFVQTGGVQGGGRTIVFDAGTGAGQLAPGTGALPAGMAAAGIRPEDVSLVCVSHFHGDHITGLTTADNQLFFPNAEIAVPAAEWAWWSDESNSARSPEGQRGTFANTARRFGPLHSRMRVFEGEAEVAPGIRAVAAHGHTPGHTAYHVASGSQQLFFTSDASSRPELFLRNPGWSSIFDFDAAMATATRRRLFSRIVAEQAVVTAYHFNFPAAGRVTRDGDGFRWHPMDWATQVV